MQAQSCPNVLSNAETRYNNGDFDHVIESLSDCLDRNAFNNNERREAYRLIGLSYIGKDREAEARQAVRHLLDVAPNYQPNPELDPPPFTRIVNEERRNTRRSTTRTGTAPGSIASPSRLQVSLHGEWAMLTTEHMVDAYNGFGGRLAITYLVTPSIGIDAIGRMDSMKLHGLTLNLTEFGLGVRYLFDLEGAFTPYLGVAGSHRTASESIEGITVKYTGIGGTVYGGFQYALNPTMATDLNVGASFGSLEHEFFEPFFTTTVNAGVGVVWSPSW